MIESRNQQDTYWPLSIPGPCGAKKHSSSSSTANAEWRHGFVPSCLTGGHSDSAKVPQLVHLTRHGRRWPASRVLPTEKSSLVPRLVVSRRAYLVALCCADRPSAIRWRYILFFTPTVTTGQRKPELGLRATLDQTVQAFVGPGVLGKQAAAIFVVVPLLGTGAVWKAIRNLDTTARKVPKGYPIGAYHNQPGTPILLWAKQAGLQSTYSS